MGKVKTRYLGDEEIEKKQIEEQKKKSLAKKTKTDVAVDESKAEVVETETKVKNKKSKKFTVSVKQNKHGKKYNEAVKKIEQKNIYNLTEAIDLIKKSSYVNFDETIELHLNVEKEGLKGEVTFPHSTGKTLTVAILDDAVLAKLDSGIIDFDILIATPSQMPRLAKYARTLGPKGLMPNPKMGTVSADPEKAAENFKKGSVRWKSESKFPIIHQVVGKKSFDNKSILENIEAFLNAVGQKNIISGYIAGSMTPSVKIAIVR